MGFSFEEILRNTVQLAVALLLGGLVGAEREVHGRWAGLRTHMLVSLGCAIFAIMGKGLEGGTSSTRVIQGIATGVGFLGAGTILKLSDREEVKGLTTAASIWLAAALGTAVGAEFYSLAIVATLATISILALKQIERRWEARIKRKTEG
jgi:putative Mg2+ transporter-C (MgtC) family protein